RLPAALLGVDAGQRISVDGRRLEPVGTGAWPVGPKPDRRHDRLGYGHPLSHGTAHRGFSSAAFDCLDDPRCSWADGGPGLCPFFRTGSGLDPDIGRGGDPHPASAGAVFYAGPYTG